MTCQWCPSLYVGRELTTRVLVVYHMIFYANMSYEMGYLSNMFYWLVGQLALKSKICDSKIFSFCGLILLYHHVWSNK